MVPDPFTVERGDHVLRLGGTLRMASASSIWQELRRAFDAATAVDTTTDAAEERRLSKSSLTIDLSGATALDGAVLSLLEAFRSDLAFRGYRADVVGVPDCFEPLVELYATSCPTAPRPRRRAGSAIEQVGRGAEALGAEVKRQIQFVGELVSTIGWLVRHPRAGNWKELPGLVERTGADAVPIVALLTFLIGFVTAYQAARQLKLYGANLYVADLVGISLSRELAPLMTAIIVCGRSGAAFTAEIGTMKVNEEVDALRTLGFRPFAWLVVPRVVALLIVVPALTVLADIVGLAGGLVVAVTSLDLTLRGYLIETQLAVERWDVASGIVKSIAFALAVGLISCQQGFSASGGAEGVGRRTTATVVSSLFALVVTDSILTVVFRIFNP